jgi:hypothetical protein
MFRKKSDKLWCLEVILVLICLALCCLLHRVGAGSMIVLNLFFLPVVLAAFFLGRYRAGVLALLCVMCVAVVMALDLRAIVASTSPLAVGLSLTLWGAVMGLNAILVGTLSDERMEKIEELHDAYLGVVEVLVQYLNSSDPKVQDRAVKVSEISQEVAVRMRLSDKEVDDIRIAALLHDIENIEVTAKVIRKAVDDLTYTNPRNQVEHTFRGADLVQSLGTVLTGALPLLLSHDDGIAVDEADDSLPDSDHCPFGARIVRTVRRYVTLRYQDPRITNPRDALDALKNDTEADHHPAVVHALEQVVLHASEAVSRHGRAEPRHGRAEPITAGGST